VITVNSITHTLRVTLHMCIMQCSVAQNRYPWIVQQHVLCSYMQ